MTLDNIASKSSFRVVLSGLKLTSSGEDGRPNTNLELVGTGARATESCGVPNTNPDFSDNVSTCCRRDLLASMAAGVIENNLE